MPTAIRVRKIEKADEPVFECNCCGKLHRIIHHMTNGAIMGKQCAELLESYCWRAACGSHQEAAEKLGLSLKQRTYVKSLGFEVA